MEPPFPSSLKIALKIQFLAIFSQFFKISFFADLNYFCLFLFILLRQNLSAVIFLLSVILLGIGELLKYKHASNFIKNLR